MDKEKVPRSLFDDLWDFFASVKLTVLVLLSLAATSIIGTLVPQNEDPVRYYRAFGEVWYRIFYMLDIFDMYHSWWFQFMLLLLHTLHNTGRTMIRLARSCWQPDQAVSIRSRSHRSR